ncbi:uncharacterized protein MONOS_16903 [Monocercomonoides exilis]|uniref:uncharacterized protein n=1 Tax=Monocercomonoides exilis TaxID=2049356 RepID=UPI00355A4B98|nr:hypothetical protein MONOS_16903 [Monocercomonoides exilis]
MEQMITKFSLLCHSSSTRVRGIDALNIVKCVVLHSSIIRSSANVRTDNGGGGMMVENMCAESMVDDCIFQNYSSDNDGDTIELYLTKTEKQKKR